MNSLTVYEDYTQCMAFLRASRNRLFNTLETSKIRPEHVTRCTDICNRLYDQHTRLGVAIIGELNEAVGSKQVEEATKAANRLHKHNRQTARLSRLFEEDISDTHPDPDDDPPPVPKPIDVSLPIECSKFLSKLTLMDVEMQKLLSQRPRTPKAPN